MLRLWRAGREVSKVVALRRDGTCNPDTARTKNPKATRPAPLRFKPFGGIRFAFSNNESLSSHHHNEFRLGTVSLKAVTGGTKQLQIVRVISSAAKARDDMYGCLFLLSRFFVGQQLPHSIADNVI